MRFIYHQLSGLRPLHFLLAIFASTLLFLSSALPAAASNSNPTKGIDALNKVEQKSKDVLNSPPRSLEETQAEAQKGINAVQGDADAAKMKRPGNSQNATSVEEKIKDTFSDFMDSE